MENKLNFDSVKDSGERQHFDTGAQRDTSKGKGRYDLLPFFAIERLAKHFENGAIKYDANNWRKGIPTTRFFDSAMRHLAKYAMGYRDEDHLVAVAWNILCLVETQHMIKNGILPMDLDNLPSYLNEKKDE